MKYLQPSIIWRAEVGLNEEFTKQLKMYHVQLQYISNRPDDKTKKYYMRCDFWAENEKEMEEQLKEIQERYGKVRQAWITKYDIKAERWPLLEEPNNIK